MTGRKRDLTGFGAKPTSKPQAPPRSIPEPPQRTSHSSVVVSPEPKTVPPPRQTSTRKNPRKRTPSRNRRRVTLSLPTQLAEQLRLEREKGDTFYLDLILGAHVDYGTDLVEETQALLRTDGTLTVGPARRRFPPGRTQVPLNIGADQLAAVDAAAQQLGLDRSGYIARILARSFQA